MKPLGKEIDSIIFDMDGTLWDATLSYCEVWKKTFADMGYDLCPSTEEIAQCMGLTIDRIFDKLISVNIDRTLFLNLLDKNEREMMPSLGGVLYNGVADGIKRLSSQFKLLMVSNCGPKGLPNFLNFTGLKPYFIDTLSNGENGKSKTDNIRLIISRNNLKNPIYVGDTQSDCDAATEAGIPFVFAAYGFGSADKAVHSVDSFDELVKYLMLDSRFLSADLQPTFRLIGDIADKCNQDCYIVGGYTRDLLLKRASKDVDFVTIGNGIRLANAVKEKLGAKAHLTVFESFGTSQIKIGKTELEFVGARRESYRRDSRKPIVENGTLDDDISRRDLTINALAICVNKNNYGLLIDRFNGINDLFDRVIRTPLDPDTTFTDDPLRMLRAIRFATQLKFTINPDTFASIKRNAERLSIISRERINDELTKIMASSKPSIGWKLLKEADLLSYICPELQALIGVDIVNGKGHKDNFLHTLQVLDHVAEKSDNIWLRWAALFHDIAKPLTKRWDDQLGWTFHSHNFVGAKMIPRIFRRMKLPMNENMKFVQKMVELHMRPIALVEDIVTDSAVRRLLFDAGNDIDDLMTLCEADITSKNVEKVSRFLDNYQIVRRRLVEIEEKDRIRNFQPPISGNDIMRYFGLPQSREVGLIKDAIKDAILDGIIKNDITEAYDFMVKCGAQHGLSVINPSQSTQADHIDSTK